MSSLEAIADFSAVATDWIAALSAAVTALATVGLVWGAFAAWKAAKATLDQMKADSMAQTRPYLQARLEYSMGGSQAADLVIRNTGLTAAREVIITIDDIPAESDDVIAAVKKNDGDASDDSSACIAS